ncbi:MAG: CRISPR-associated endonuclease Cas1 [Verrucomicrobiota bacterium JB025]|nr:CRISPR-associated endonuclease Cas1 [Verrucomicrobiota bacterium JB025]
MPTACIQQPGASVRLESERLLVSFADEDLHPQKRVIPLHDVDRLILTDAVSLSSPALAELLRRQIPVSLTDTRGRFLGAFHPASPAHGASRLHHYQRTLDPSFTLATATRIIVAKIYNQRRLLQRVAANRRAANRPVPESVDPALAALNRSMAAAGRAASLDSLRGHEGTAAARYFSAWASLLPDSFPFERRSTRPPLNPVNAALSFSSTLLYNEMHAFLHAHGLDPALGLLHTTENNRWSLALDLIEPFRPVVAEALTLDLFSHKILSTDHFEPKNGGTYLTRQGRGKLLLQYEKRMERQFMSESAGHRTTLRRQLENQATLLKTALDRPDSFEPFLMN